MIIGTDLDDVLGDFNRSMAVFHNKKYGSNYKYEDIFTPDICAFWNCTEQESLEMLHSFFESEYHDNILPVQGAIEAIERLAQNHEIHIITSKPQALKDRTLLWLDKHFPKVFKSLHFTDKFGKESNMKDKKTKAEICRELGIVYFIDDMLANVESISDAGIKTLLLDKPWNQAKIKSPLVTRVYSWDDIIKHISK